MSTRGIGFVAPASMECDSSLSHLCHPPEVYGYVRTWGRYSSRPQVKLSSLISVSLFANSEQSAGRIGR